MRESFIRYVNTGEGTSVFGGATADPPVLRPGASAPLTYTFHFPFASGWHDAGANPADPADDTAAIGFSGAVRFLYSAHGIDLTTENPEIEIAGARSRAIFTVNDGKSTQRQVLVNLDLSRAAAITATGELHDLRPCPWRGSIGDRHVGVRRLLRTGNGVRVLHRQLLDGPLIETGPEGSSGTAQRASWGLASSACDRHTVRWLRRMAGAALADDAQVTVVAPGGEQQTLSLDALAGGEDVVEGTYAIRSAAGESTQTVTGFSLEAILGAAGTDPFGFSYLEAQRPAGGSVLLSRHQALDPRSISRWLPGGLRDGDGNRVPAPQQRARRPQLHRLLRGTAGNRARPPQGLFPAGASQGIDDAHEPGKDGVFQRDRRAGRLR